MANETKKLSQTFEKIDSALNILCSQDPTSSTLRILHKADNSTTIDWRDLKLTANQLSISSSGNTSTLGIHSDILDSINSKQPTIDSTNKLDADYLKAGVTNKLFTGDEKTKLEGISANAKKVEASTTNGNIKIDGSETVVYTEVANTVHDSNYAHITVTENSVSDGTYTFNKYDDTTLAGRVSTIEGKEAGWDAKQSALGDTQLAACNSGITADKVSTYDGYSTTISSKAADTDVVHLAGAETITGQKTFSESILPSGTVSIGSSTAKWSSIHANNIKASKIYNGGDIAIPTTAGTMALVSDLTSKQDALDANQLNAVNSGITSAKVSTYDGYDTTIASKAADNSVVHLDSQETISGLKLFTGTVASQPASSGVSLGLDNTSNAAISLTSATTSAAQYIDFGPNNTDFDFRIIKWQGGNEGNRAQFVYGGSAGTISIPRASGTMALTSDLDSKQDTLTYYSENSGVTVGNLASLGASIHQVDGYITLSFYNNLKASYQNPGAPETDRGITDISALALGVNNKGKFLRANASTGAAEWANDGSYQIWFDATPEGIVASSGAATISKFHITWEEWVTTCSPVVAGREISLHNNTVMWGDLYLQGVLKTDIITPWASYHNEV